MVPSTMAVRAPWLRSPRPQKDPRRDAAPTEPAASPREFCQAGTPPTGGCALNTWSLSRRRSGAPGGVEANELLMNDAADGAVPGEGSSPLADSVTPVDCAIAKDRTTAAIFDTRWVPAILLSLLVSHPSPTGPRSH